MLHSMPTASPTVAASVRAELARAGVSGRQLARDLDWSPGVVQRLLAGEREFKAPELIAIARHLGIPSTTFLADEAGGRAAS